MHTNFCKCQTETAIFNRYCGGEGLRSQTVRMFMNLSGSTQSYFERVTRVLLGRDHRLKKSRCEGGGEWLRRRRVFPLVSSSHARFLLLTFLSSPRVFTVGVFTVARKSNFESQTLKKKLKKYTICVNMPNRSKSLDNNHLRSWLLFFSPILNDTTQSDKLNFRL